jgi:hypothetical protein
MLKVHPTPEMFRSADLLYAYQCGQDANRGDASARATAELLFADDPEAREQYEFGLTGRQMNGAPNPAFDKSLH